MQGREPLARFDQIVFSGGGTRCFWHGGFLSVAGGIEAMRPARISGVSGGALSAAAWISGHDDRCREVMRDAFVRNHSNIDPASDNLTPHQELYRQVVSDTLAGDAIDAIAQGPAFQVTLGCPPKGLPPRAGAALAITLYELDHAVRSSPHIRFSHVCGLRPLRVDARKAARGGKLIDLICAAATIPPVFDIPVWEGQPVIDGGTTDKAPMPHPDKGETLLLLTRRYRNLPRIAGRTYVQPSRTVEADKIDFTDPHKIDATWKQGVGDGEQWLENRARAAEA